MRIKKAVSLCSFFRDHIERDKVKFSNGDNTNILGVVKKKMFINNSSPYNTPLSCLFLLEFRAQSSIAWQQLGGNTGNSTSTFRPLAFQCKIQGWQVFQKSSTLLLGREGWREGRKEGRREGKKEGKEEGRRGGMEGWREGGKQGNIFWKSLTHCHL